ncbi:hypothetical protein BU17DRAFT_100589 [Hysterangium stoloniferum]|nr:hypothetical protein BU17DRAFT_100589 [Hysterangium stoloniferum]
MFPHTLQPSPFSPDQFLANPGPVMQSTLAQSPFLYPYSSDEEISTQQGFIKKRPFEITEELVEGRFPYISSRLRRRRSQRALFRGCSELPDFVSACPMDVDPKTPPNRPQSPSHDVAMTRGSDCIRYSPISRRLPKNRRSAKPRRPCSPPSKKPGFSREGSPAPLHNRSPLGRWTPPSVSTLQLYSPERPDLPMTPTRRTALITTPSPAWANGYPWTIASPSSSPYSSHSPLPSQSEHHA